MTNEELKYTNMRSIRIIILNILWMLLAIPSYAYDFEVDGLCYNKLSNNQVEITYKEYYGGSYSGTLIIPSKVTCNGVTYNVTSIGNRAFYKCTGLTGSLSIPNSITSIGKDAFDFESFNFMKDSSVFANEMSFENNSAFSSAELFSKFHSFELPF